MKKKNILIAFVAAVSLVTVSCTEKKLSPDSVISAPSVEKNAFDLWLDYNFLKPYNIDFHYRYDLNESDMYRMTIPADYDASIMYAHLVQYLCIDTYNEVAGVDFTKAYFPKIYSLICSSLALKVFCLRKKSVLYSKNVEITAETPVICNFEPQSFF